MSRVETFREIYSQLTSCIDTIETICDGMKTQVEEIKRSTNSEKLQKNKSLVKNLQEVIDSTKLLSSICALWNIDQDGYHIPIYSAGFWAFKLYHRRAGVNGPKNVLFQNKTFDLTAPDKRTIIEAKFSHIRNNSLALIPYILIDNATKYARSGSDVYVSFSEDYKFSVINVGPALDNGEEVKVYEKGYRGRNAQCIQSSGMGLGLYFAKNILEKFGCTIGISQGSNVEAVVDNVEYRTISVTVDFSSYTETCMDYNAKEYYDTIDEMFGHEYTNISQYINSSLLKKLAENLEIHSRNLGMTDEERDLLMPLYDQLNSEFKKLFFILRKYTFRNDALVSTARSGEDICWITTFIEAERQFKKNLAELNITVDALVNNHRNQMLPIGDYSNLSFPRIKTYDVIREIPMLVYDLIHSLADRDTTARITLTPIDVRGNRRWQNTITFDVKYGYSDLIRNSIITITSNPDNGLSHIELLIAMLHSYLDKVNSEVNLRINNQNVTLEFHSPY